MKPDVICVVETWLNSGVTDNELILPNCQLFPRDRNRQGGGVYSYLCISVQSTCSDGPSNLEFISVSTASSLYSEKLCLSLFYHPPSSPVSIFNDFCTTMCMLSPSQFSNIQC